MWMHLLPSSDSSHEVHRDVKTENILLQSGDVPVLADFGQTPWLLICLAPNRPDEQSIEHRQKTTPSDSTRSINMPEPSTEKWDGWGFECKGKARLGCARARTKDKHWKHSVKQGQHGPASPKRWS